MRKLTRLIQPTQTTALIAGFGGCVDKVMIINNELRELDEPTLFRKLSYANLECASRLVRQMLYKRGALPETIHHANVVLSLIYHSVELFLKFAITQKGEKAPSHHYMRELKEMYDNLYPDKAFYFDTPFITEYLGFSEEELIQALKNEKKRKNQGEQIYRYHTDQTGKPWEIGLGFDPRGILDFCKYLLKCFKKIEKKITQTL